MIKMKRVIPVVALLALANTTLADVEFGDEIPREVVEQLVADPFGGGETKLYTDIPSAFPPFTLPDGFEVLASVDQGRQQRVILRTELGEPAIKTAIAAAFSAQGWTELPAFGGNAPQTGFVSAMPPPQPLQLCSDQLGRLNLGVSGEGPRYANLNLTTASAFFGGNRQSCAEQVEMMTQGPRAQPFRSGDMQQYIPTLVLPESDVPNALPPRSFIGGGGSSNDFETESVLQISWSGGDLLDYFAEQVEAQGWATDSAVNGSEVAFGSWTRTVDGNALIGMLTLTKTAENSWDLKFRIVRQSGAAP